MIDAAELARLREACAKAFVVSFNAENGCYMGDMSAKTVLALLDGLEKAQREAKEAWAGVRVRDETINVTVKKRTAQRDSARALLREALPWVGHMSDDPSIGLRARIKSELGEVR
jgi:hypothetical protein